MPPGNNLNDRIKMPSLKGVRYEILLSIFSATLFGGLSGEILDNTPYLQHAIPEGIGYIKSILSGEYISLYSTTGSLQGNLDKLGSGLGFLSGFFGRLK